MWIYIVHMYMHMYMCMYMCMCASTCEHLCGIAQTVLLQVCRGSVPALFH